MIPWRLRPARDLGLPMAARWRSVRRESGLGGAMVQAGWRWLLRSWLALYHRLRIEGRENLPPAPPYVLVANHSSHLDAMVLGAALRGAAAERAFTLAAGDHFFDTDLTAAFAVLAVNALPVWRAEPLRAAADIALLRERLVEDGCVFILFPEGTRSRSGAMGSFHAGLGVLVAGTGVPVVPCHIGGAFAAWPPQRRWPRPGRVTLRIGKRTVFPAADHGSRAWKKIAVEVEALVKSLTPSL